MGGNRGRWMITSDRKWTSDYLIRTSGNKQAPFHQAHSNSEARQGVPKTGVDCSSMASAFTLPRLPERNARAARYSMSLLFLARRKPFTETFPHFTVGRGSPRTPLRRPSSAGDVLLCADVIVEEEKRSSLPNLRVLWCPLYSHRACKRLLLLPLRITLRLSCLFVIAWCILPVLCVSLLCP